LSLWAYLEAKNFQPSFIEKIAKQYWQKACCIVKDTPYGHVISRGGVDSERRLMTYLLRQVCKLMSQET
jgi:hypothetical protein